METFKWLTDYIISDKKDGRIQAVSRKCKIKDEIFKFLINDTVVCLMCFHENKNSLTLKYFYKFDLLKNDFTYEVKDFEAYKFSLCKPAEKLLFDELEKIIANMG